MRKLRELDLRIDRGRVDRDGERQAAGEFLGDPVHQLASFDVGELVDLGAKSQHGHAVRAVVDKGLYLPSSRALVQTALRVEKSVQHRIDPVRHVVIAHCDSSRAASYTLAGDASNSTASVRIGVPFFGVE